MEDKEQRIKIQFDTNADETSKKVDGLSSKLGNNTKETDKVSESQKKAAKSSKDLGGSIDDLGGPIGQAISGFKGMIKQAWLLVANPIVATFVAIAGALALVFKAFTSTNDGADKLDQILSGLGAVVDVLRDRFLKLISLDFKGAFSGVGDEIEKEFKSASKLAKAIQDVEDATRNLGVSRAKLNRDLAAAKEIITDETASYDEKKKAIEAVRIAEGKQTESELANAKKKLKSIEDQNSLSDTSDEDLQKEADARSALYALEQKSAEDRRSIRKTELRADNEEKSRIKEITDAKKAAYKERLEAQKEAAKLAKDVLDKENEAYYKKVIDDGTKAQLELNDINQIGLDAAKLIADEKEKLRAEEVDAEVRKGQLLAEQVQQQIAIEQAAVQQKQEIEAQKFALAERGVQLIAGIFGKSKKVQKAAMIAESAISIGKQVAANNVANIGALATPQAIATSGAAAVPVIALNNISTGVGIASTIAATAKALQSLGGGSAPSDGGGSTPRPGGGGGSSSATPQVSFQASRENQIATSVSKNNANQPPIQAFVVGKQVTTQQSLDNNKIKSNSI